MTADGMLSPDLLRAATFSQPRRRAAAVDEGEVRQLLDRAAAGWQADADAAVQARAELARLRAGGPDPAEREATRVLRTAQEVADQVIADAQHQAKLTVEDARITADRITGEAGIQAGRVRAAADIKAGSPPGSPPKRQSRRRPGSPATWRSAITCCSRCGRC